MCTVLNKEDVCKMKEFWCIDNISSTAVKCIMIKKKSIYLVQNMIDLQQFTNHTENVLTT